MVILLRVVRRDRCAGTAMLLRAGPTLHDLHMCIKLNDLNELRRVLTTGRVNVNSSLLSCTALSLAIYRADDAVVAELLGCGADANKLSSDWNQRLEPPLFAACRLGKVACARMLLERGADVNCGDQWHHTPLWIAVRERQCELAQLLIKCGARLSMGDKWAQCPLYFATKYHGRERLAVTLIQHGARLSCTDTEGNSPLYWTLVNGKLDLARYLLLAGAHACGRTRRMIADPNAAPESFAGAPQPSVSHLRSAISQPLSLRRLSTIAVRHRLAAVTRGASVWPAVDRLPISEQLKLRVKVMPVDG